VYGQRNAGSRFRKDHPNAGAGASLQAIRALSTLIHIDPWTEVDAVRVRDTYCLSQP
jgi:hypothetical protein